MKKVLITGATGNVGREVLCALEKIDHRLDLYSGVRDVKNESNALTEVKAKPLHFDFTDSNTFGPALEVCDILFLLRPPQLSEVEKYFRPLINLCKIKRVGHIVFLSVQGVENSTIIPHHKIEKLIVESQISYTFLRPAYFMQNFTTTLLNDIVKNKRIYLPAGKAKFTLIDVRDVGAVAARILSNVTQHTNKCYELTNHEKLTFLEMAIVMSTVLKRNIRFISPSLIKFFLNKRKEKVPSMFILVMIMLHYFPRFQKEPQVTQWVEIITDKQPATFEHFVKDNVNIFTRGEK